MYIKTVEYEDFDGVKKSKTLYFNMSRSELIKASLNENNLLEEKLTAMAKSRDTKAMGKLFADIVGMSYGVKSDDGETFDKSEELRAKFEHSAAYDALFIDLLQNVDSAIAFIKGIIPKQAGQEIDLENDPKFKELMNSVQQ